MQSTEQFRDVFHELLAPVQQSWSDCADGDVDIPYARRQLQQAAETLEDIGDEASALVARTLGWLLEIADDLALEGHDNAPEARGELVSFVGKCLNILHDSFADDQPDAEAPLSEFVAEANERWGEALRLLSDDVRWATSAGPYAESDSAEDAPADDVAGLGETGQVDLILSALTEAAEASAAESNTPATEHIPSPAPAQSAPGGPSNGAPQAVEIAPYLLEAYLEDACQCLASMERAALEFENNPDSPAPIEQLCRELHTLKGASGSVGLTELATQLHDVEEALENPETAARDAGVVDLVMDCVDAVREKIAILQSTPQASAESTSSAARETNSVSSLMPAGTNDVSDGRDSVRVRTAQLDRLMDLLAELVIWRRRRDERVTQLDSAADELSHCLYRLESMDDLLKYDEPRGSGREVDGVGLSSKYLTEISNDVREITQALRQSRRVMAEENRAVSQFILQFRQELVQIRRVPLAGLFQRLHRSVREAARVEGKQVRLELVGEHAGLERSLQERLYEPLMHLVRNAVSHGVEAPEQRVKVGKDPVGTVTVEAYGSPHVLIIEIRDDGGGLDYDAIRRRGMERGLIFADRPASNSELARLIFRPGFSTRDEASEISGRGVGMDVVATALDRCHCHIETESESGKGTRFRLTIPLRSVIEHALLFRCGGQSFGIPMQFVRSATQSGQEQPSSTSRSHSANLAELLQLSGTDSGNPRNWLEIGDRLASSLGEATADGSATEHRLGLFVDEVLGPEEVVVRPLPPLLRRHPHLCGATLSGAGDVVFLLDGRRLLQDSFDRKFSGSPASSEVPPAADQDGPAGVEILVVDDSLSARRRLVHELSEFGFEITEASDGAEAIDYLRQRSFDAVFSDLEMPHMSGFDLLSELQNLPRSAPPCVIVTTRNEAETRDRARALGADGFLPKPVDEKAVAQILDQLQITPLIPLSGDA